jgi:hypothetical protein
MVWYGTVWYGMVRYGTVWYGMVRYGTVWYGMVRYGMVWYGMARGEFDYVVLLVCWWVVGGGLDLFRTFYSQNDSMNKMLPFRIELVVTD